MKMDGRYLLLLTLTLWACVARAQPRFRVQYYSTEQGLSHQAITTMVKDREGFMWFGTWDGINRFDGKSFTAYKSLPGDHSNLGNGRIDQIVEDQSHHLWLQAYDREVYCFDKHTTQFQPLSSVISANGGPKASFRKILHAGDSLVWVHSFNDGIFCVPQNLHGKPRIYQYKPGLPDGFALPADIISFFHVDRDRRIWIGTPHALTCLQRKADGVYKVAPLVPAHLAKGVSITDIEEDATQLYGSTTDGRLLVYNKISATWKVQQLTTGRINALFISRRDNKLLATTQQGAVLRIDPRDLTVQVFQYPARQPLHSLYEDRQGYLWIEPDQSGVVRLDPFTNRFRLFSPVIETSLPFIGNRYRVLEDNNGIVWVNLKGGGFGYYNATKESIDHTLPVSETNNYALPPLVVNVYYDPAGVLWCYTNERELVKVVPQRMDFHQQWLAAQHGSKWANEVRSLLYDRQHRLWMGVKKGELFVYNNQQRLTGLFVNEPPEGFGGVYAMVEDDRGNIWLGTKGNGLFKAMPVDAQHSKYKLVHYREGQANSEGLTCREIYSLLKDRQGRIWIGAFNGGLYQVDDAGPTTRFVHSSKLFTEYPATGFDKIRHMALDSAGNMWIGTTGGLLVLDVEGKQATPYRCTGYSKVPGDIASIGNNDIQFIHRDGRQHMWIATSGGGLARATGNRPFQALRFRNYTTKDGMPNNYVLSCTEDRQGNLWLATENGLTKMDPDTETFRNYDSYDGLPRVSFSEATVCRLPDKGQIALGTNSGLLWFEPEQIVSKAVAANIAFTNLQVNSEEAGPGMPSSVLQQDINYVAALTLTHDQRIIALDFAILDHRSGDHPAFAYRLLGFDSVWRNDRQSGRATYTNLSPGKYVFEVKSLTGDLYSNAPFRQLPITILPPPWKTGWAYTLYALIIVVILYFIHRYALTIIRLREKIAVEQKLAALKQQFFTNVSHELRTPLTLIVTPLEQLERKGKLSAEGAGYLAVARKNADRMVRFINQLLDLRKVQSDKAVLQVSRIELVPFVKRIGEYFAEELRNKKVRLEFTTDTPHLVAWADADKLDVVIYNLLSNALKFSPEGGVINIAIQEKGQERFFIAIADQGPGVPPDQLPAIFELFQVGDQPAGQSTKGIGIGLALCKEFVLLHGGYIGATINEQGGLTVDVELPGTAAYYQAQEAVQFIDRSPAAPMYQKTLEQQLVPHATTQPVTGDTPLPVVLLVEDNDELRAFIRSQLMMQYQVETAIDGVEGLEKATRLVPDLIVTDIMMPRMDGIALLDRLKNDPQTSHIPVVLLSARYSIESQIEGLRYGADHYITKPFQADFLFASIDNLLRQRRKLFDSLVSPKKVVAPDLAPVSITDKDETFLKDVIRVVESKMGDAGFHIEAVAESMAMSRTMFYKKFKSLTNMTPVEFVRDLRLQRAKQLLDSKAYTVSEVAYMTGFSSPGYFSTCFKERYQLAPSEYLKLQTPS